MSLIRIAVIGPESSGKSSLCEELARHYQTIWIPEYAREYLNNLQRKYTIDDVISIYQKQFENEQLAEHKNRKIIFIDTEFIIAKVWCEHAFGSCPKIIENMIQTHPYDYYLLTSPDLPWVFDPLRENPGKGEYFFDWYKKILEENNFRYDIVSGENDARMKNAIANVDAFLKEKNNIP